MTTDSLTIARPDDWHLHLRDGAAMASVLPHSARQFARAIVMPNLKPPVTSTDQASAYKRRIKAALPNGSVFEPLMTLYLTDATSPNEIRRGRDSGVVHAVKLYPAGSTTNSESGVTNLRSCAFALAEMQRVGMPLLIHGEVTRPQIDVFDRERIFIDEVLIPIRRDFPELWEWLTRHQRPCHPRERRTLTLPETIVQVRPGQQISLRRRQHPASRRENLNCVWPSAGQSQRQSPAPYLRRGGHRGQLTVVGPGGVCPLRW